ncbi:MAG: hypothetical protein AB9891_18700 [Anaerolineaceae bacterium]
MTTRKNQVKMKIYRLSRILVKQMAIPISRKMGEIGPGSGDVTKWSEIKPGKKKERIVRKKPRWNSQAYIRGLK